MKLLLIPEPQLQLMECRLRRVVACSFGVASLLQDVTHEPMLNVISSGGRPTIMTALKPFAGTQRTLVLALDFGTTYSGVAYAVLDPGLVPQIQPVARFPQCDDFRIPSVVCYTEDGCIHAVGAEAKNLDVDLEAGDGGLQFVEWFKLCLCPRSMRPGGISNLPPPKLPPGKTPVRVIADYLSYLFECARRYIQESRMNGEKLWTSVEGRVEVVLSHPNGWELLQQANMRGAATLAGLVSDDPVGRARLHFVSEGEAGLHYCVNSGVASEAIRDGSSIMIVDCGGGTADFTTYKFTTANPVQVEEIAQSDCILQGSTQVDRQFEKFLAEKLQDSKFGTDEYTLEIRRHFENSTKLIFADPTIKSSIKFGVSRDTDPSVGILRGWLAIEGKDMASFFQPSIDAISDAIRNQRKAASCAVKVAFLIGGFAANNWLYTQLKANLERDGVLLYRPDSYKTKPVAEGAVSFFLTQLVAARVAQVTYGVEGRTPYLPSNIEHWERRDRVCTALDGVKKLSCSFQTFVARGTRLTENAEVRYPYHRLSTNRANLDVITSYVICYRGLSSNPEWTDVDPFAYSTLCNVRANLSGVSMAKKKGPGGWYFEAIFDIILKVGRTELQAQIAWKENGIEKRGPAEIISMDE